MKARVYEQVICPNCHQVLFNTDHQTCYCGQDWCPRYKKEYYCRTVILKEVKK